MASDSVIYFVQRTNGDIKIGTTNRLTPRLSQLKSAHGPITLLGIISGGHVKEKILHWCLSDFRLDGEWFKSTPKIQAVIDEYAIVPTTRSTATPNKTGDKQMLITLPEDKVQRLRDMAFYHGYILDRSPLKGQGSIRQMLIALADGDLVLYPAMVKDSSD